MDGVILRGVFAPEGRGRQPAFPTEETSDAGSWADPFFAMAWSKREPDLWVIQQENRLVGWYGYIYRCPEGMPIRPDEIWEGYRAEGPSFFRRLGGSFVVCLYDGQQRQLIIASDRLASRHLFYSWRSGTLTFATDIQSVLACPGVSRQWDERSVVEFLRFTMILGERTLYRDILLLLPASVMTVTPEGVRIERYWVLQFDERWGLSEEEYVEGLQERFVQAVRRAMPEGRKTGLMLSGGLDSRMIAAVLSRLDMPLTAVTFGGFENDEVRLARRVAKAAGLPFAFLKREPDYYFSILPRAIQISNGLYIFYHAHMLGLHPAVRALGVETLLHGWGLDLLFSGTYFPRRQVRHLPGRSFLLLQPHPLRDEANILESLLKRLSLSPGLEGVLRGRWGSLYREWPPRALAERVAQSREYAGDPYNRNDWVIVSQFSKFRSFLYPLSVRWGVGERCPLYDPDLLEWYLGMPPRLRFASRAYGQALARLHRPLARLPYSRIGCSVLSPPFWQNVSYILLPTVQRLRWIARQIRGLHRSYPAEAFDSYPQPDRLMRQKPWGTLLRERLPGGPLVEGGVVEPAALQELLARHLEGRGNFGDHLMAMLSLNLWLMETEGRLD